MRCRAALTEVKWSEVKWSEVKWSEVNWTELVGDNSWWRSEVGISAMKWSDGKIVVNASKSTHDVLITLLLFFDVYKLRGL
jgi:hypothetical protein